ncbi:MAG: hypothetical protein EXR70_11865 [Deltaproteobacteria bacterium]|nr:hypothetical protein [Deltaproteobacteria bacterium]
MTITDPKLIATEFDFVSALMPDYIAPTLDGIKLILENFGKKYPDAPRHDPKEFADGSIIERLKQEKFAEGLKS